MTCKIHFLCTLTQVQIGLLYRHCTPFPRATSIFFQPYQYIMYVDIVTYPNLPASAEKCPLSNSSGMYMYVTVGSPVFAASVPLQIMRRSWSTLMSCGWRPLLGTDTLVSLTGTPTTELRVAMVLGNIPLWCEKEKTRTTMLNTLAREIFFYILSYKLNFRPSSKVELFMYRT